MATTINAYSVSLGLNAQGMIDGGMLARNEMAALKRTMAGLESPAEKVERKIDLVQRAFDKGAISAAHAKEAIDRLNASLQKQSTITTPDIATDAHISRLDKFTTSLKSAAIAYVSFATAQQAVQAVLRSADALDKLDNSAKKIGESVENLQRFYYSAKLLANLEREGVDSGLTKLNKAIGEAILGSKEMRDNLQGIGLDVRELAGQSPVEQFMAISDALSRIDNPAKRAAEAQRIFGKSAAELIPILSAGSDAIREQFSEAERLGIVLDEKAVTAAANAADELDRMTAALGGLVNTVTVELAPAIQSITQAVTGLSQILRMEVGGQTVGGLLLGGSLTGMHSGGLAPGIAAKFFMPKMPAEIESSIDAEAMGKRAANTIGDAMGGAFSGTLKKLQAAAKEAAVEQDKFDRKFSQLSNQALANATQHFEHERSRQMRLHEEVAKGPGTSGLIGSADAARFAASQINAKIADIAVPEKPTPGEQELIEETKKQFALLQAQEKKQEAMVDTLKQLLDEAKQNGFRRAR